MRGDTAITSVSPAIAATGLRKSYGDRVALDGIDLKVAPGTIYALLGPAGAGKTTVARILATLVRPDSGVVRVASHDLRRDPAAIRAAIGFCAQVPAVDDVLSGEENVLLMAALLRIGRAEARRKAAYLLNRFELTDVAGQTPAGYSRGMRRRLDLAMAMVGEPRLVLLDEPTTGLDPHSRQVVWRALRELAADDGTVMLTSMCMAEADLLADRIALLHNGKLVAEGTPDELRQLVPGGYITLRFADARALECAAYTFGNMLRDDNALTLQIPSDGSVRSVQSVLDRLDDGTIEVESLSVHTPDLNDVFSALTRRAVPR